MFESLHFKQQEKIQRFLALAKEKTEVIQESEKFEPKEKESPKRNLILNEDNPKKKYQNPPLTKKDVDLVGLARGNHNNNNIGANSKTAALESKYETEFRKKSHSFSNLGILSPLNMVPNDLNTQKMVQA